MFGPEKDSVEIFERQAIRLLTHLFPPLTPVHVELLAHIFSRIGNTIFISAPLGWLCHGLTTDYNPQKTNRYQEVAPSNLINVAARSFSATPVSNLRN